MSGAPCSCSHVQNLRGGAGKRGRRRDAREHSAGSRAWVPRNVFALRTGPPGLVGGPGSSWCRSSAWRARGLSSMLSSSGPPWRRASQWRAQRELRGLQLQKLPFGDLRSVKLLLRSSRGMWSEEGPPPCGCVCARSPVSPPSFLAPLPSPLPPSSRSPSPRAPPRVNPTSRAYPLPLTLTLSRSAPAQASAQARALPLSLAGPLDRRCQHLAETFLPRTFLEQHQKRQPAARAIGRDVGVALLNLAPTPAHGNDCCATLSSCLCHAGCRQAVGASATCTRGIGRRVSPLLLLHPREGRRGDVESGLQRGEAIVRSVPEP